MQVAAIPSDPNVREKVIGILKQRFGDQFTTADAIRERHGKGESYHDTAAPDGVFFPIRQKKWPMLYQSAQITSFLLFLLVLGQP